MIEAEQAVEAISRKLVELAELGPGDTVLDAERAASRSRPRCCGAGTTASRRSDSPRRRAQAGWPLHVIDDAGHAPIERTDAVVAGLHAALWREVEGPEP